MAAANTTTKARRKKLKPSPFHVLRYQVGLGDLVQAAEFCGVTPRTIQNWDRKGAPFVAMRLLHLYDRKSCAGQGADWSGWMFSRGLLINKRLGLRFCPRSLERLPYLQEVFSRLEGARLRWREDGVGPDVVAYVLDGGPRSRPGPGSLPLAGLLAVVSGEALPESKLSGTTLISGPAPGEVSHVVA